MNSLESNQARKIHEQVFDKQPFSILLFNLDDRIVYCNPEATLLLGCKKEEIIGKSIMEIDDFSTLKSQFAEIKQKLINGNTFIELDDFNIQKDNHQSTWVKIRASLLQLESKCFFQLLIEAISEKKKIEQDLAKERNTIKNFIELNPYAIVIYSSDGYYMSSNLAHYEIHQSVPTPEYNIFNDQVFMKNDFANTIYEEIKAGKVVHVPEMWYNAHDAFPEMPDKPICLRTVIFPIKNPNGKIENYVFMYEDITERKIVEKELEKLKNDLETRVRARTIKLENSEKKYLKAYNRANCFKGLFTHDISNMFQTIGNSIEICHSFLKEGIKKDQILENLIIFNLPSFFKSSITCKDSPHS